MKHIDRLFLCILLSIVFIGCKNEHKPSKKNKNEDVSKTPLFVDVLENQYDGIPLNANIFGFNTAYLYQDILLSNHEVIQKIKALHPSLIRFPGGTVANYYHPNGEGFGFRDEEMMLKEKMREIKQKQNNFTSDAQEDAIKLCKETQSKVVYVVNILTGTPEEAIIVIDRFLKNDIQVVGVELGNELYFKEYRKEFPNVEAYIKKCMPFAERIRMKYPSIKIGVLSPKYKEDHLKDENTLFYKDWNNKLSQEYFYDAVIAHYYVNSKPCQSSKKNIEQMFDCSYRTFNILDQNLLGKIRQQLKNTYKNKEIWLTEFNINKPQEYFGNTMSQAFLLGEYLFGMMKNSQGEMPYTIGAVHQLASEVAPFAMVYLKNNKAEITASYLLYQMFGGLSSENTLVKEINNKGGGFSYLLAEDISTKKQILIYMNKSNKEIKINWGTQNTCLNNYIKGENLWATKDNLFSKTSNLSVAPPISFGVITYNK